MVHSCSATGLHCSYGRDINQTLNLRDIYRWILMMTDCPCLVDSPALIFLHCLALFFLHTLALLLAPGGTLCLCHWEQKYNVTRLELFSTCRADLFLEGRTFRDIDDLALLEDKRGCLFLHPENCGDWPVPVHFCTCFPWQSGTAWETIILFAKNNSTIKTCLTYSGLFYLRPKHK